MNSIIVDNFIYSLFDHVKYLIIYEYMYIDIDDNFKAKDFCEHLNYMTEYKFKFTLPHYYFKPIFSNYNPLNEKEVLQKTMMEESKLNSLNTLKKNITEFFQSKYSDDEYAIICISLLEAIYLLSLIKFDITKITNIKILKDFKIDEDEEVIQAHTSSRRNSYFNIIRNIIHMGANVSNTVKESAIVFNNIFKYTLSTDKTYLLRTLNIHMLSKSEIHIIYNLLNKDAQKYVHDKFKEMVNLICNDKSELKYIFTESDIEPDESDIYKVKIDIITYYIEIFGGNCDDWTNYAINYPKIKAHINKLFN